MVYLSISLCDLFLSSVPYSFLSTGLFSSSGRFSPRYFFLVVAMVNGIVSFISLYVLSLLVCMDARDFCALILYPANLYPENSLISSSNFLMVSLGFSM